MADATIKFKGDAEGAFVSGVPARDLSKADYDALDTDLRATVRNSPLYDYAGYRDATQPAPKAAEKAQDAPQDAKPS